MKNSEQRPEREYANLSATVVNETFYFYEGGTFGMTLHFLEARSKPKALHWPTTKIVFLMQTACISLNGIGMQGY